MIRKVVLNSLYFSGAQAALAPFMRGMGSIFMLHHVRNIHRDSFSPNYHLYASPEFLDKMISRLKGRGFEFLSMDQVAKRLAAPEKFAGAPPFAAITLDDGYRDNLENAIPVFRRHEVPYLVYVAPGITERESTLWWEDLENIIRKQKMMYVDLPRGRVDFDLSTPGKKTAAYKKLIEYLLLDASEDDQRMIVADLAAAYKVNPVERLKEEVLNWSEICALSDDPLCSIGAHTIGHYALAKLPEDTVRFEMKQSREIIKSETGVKPKHFAYPYGFPGVAGAREFRIARECGFKTAVTTRHGVIYPEHKDHMTALPRVSVNGHHQSMHYINTLLSGVPSRVRNLGRKLDVA